MLGDEIKRKVAEMLAVVDLTGREKRPRELSGGQQQRVAVARALRTAPVRCCSTSRSGRWTFKLRQHMQVELKRIQREVGVTFVYAARPGRGTDLSTGSPS